MLLGTEWTQEISPTFSSMCGVSIARSSGHDSKARYLLHPRAAAAQADKITHRGCLIYTPPTRQRQHQPEPLTEGSD